MADEVINDAPEGQQDSAQVDTLAPKPRARPKAKVAVDDGGGPPDHDPMMSQMVSTQRELADLKKALETERRKTQQFERDARKQTVFAALADEFPGLPRDEIRGAALVAAEDGAVDLYSSDTKGVVDKLKEALRAKSKKTTAASTPSLGGTPGSASKPPPGQRRFLI